MHHLIIQAMMSCCVAVFNLFRHPAHLPISSFTLAGDGAASLACADGVICVVTTLGRLTCVANPSFASYEVVRQMPTTQPEEQWITVSYALYHMCAISSLRGLLCW